MATDPDDGDDEDSEWRFSLSDLGDDADTNGDGDEDGTAETDTSSDDGDEGTLDAGVAGSLDVDDELEAGDIDLENAVFVVVGVLLALAFLAGFLLLP